jgi:hypothetical protein
MQKKFDAIWWIVLAAGAILAVNMASGRVSACS